MSFNKMGRYLFFCFLFIFETRVGASFSKSRPRFFPVPEGHITDTKVFYPYSKSNCICSKNRVNFFLQCEEIFVSKGYRYSKNTDMSIECNKTATSGDLNHDFSNLLGLNGLQKIELSIKDCPEPSVSFVRQLFPPKNENLIFSDQEITMTNVEEIENHITDLDIVCQERKKYTLSKRHLESLYNLVEFRVACFALKSLPWDLFQGTTPSLKVIIIERTQIEEIPSMLFYNLTELRKVNLGYNFIKRIKGDAFLGCKSLSTLDLEKNNLSYLGENVLNTLENVSSLTLSYNRFRVMPSNFSKMNRLIQLGISHNVLEQLKKEDCDGLTQLQNLDINYNGITHVHPNCIPNNLIYLRISGNSLQNITENPIELNNLWRFYFSDNSISQLDVKKFFVSERLSDIYMSNSNVLSIDAEAFHDFPRLDILNLSKNKITSIPEDLFVNNEKIRKIYFESNNISSLPSGLFRRNLKLVYLDLSRNRISKLPKHIFSQNTSLETLNFAFNHIHDIPARFLANITSLKVLNFSNNHITELHNDFLEGMTDLDQLDLSYNSLLYIQSEIFSPKNTSINLRRLLLQRNNISQFPVLTLEKLEYLDISRNMLQYTNDSKMNNLTLYTPSLKELYLSKNYFQFIPFLPYEYSKHLRILDLSYNNISFDRYTYYFYLFLPNEHFSKRRNLYSIDLSYNKFSFFLMDEVWLDNDMEKLNLSNNNIDHFEVLSTEPNFTKLKILDMCSNNLSLPNSPIDYSKTSLSWGFVSIFTFFPNLEELHLRNNSISFIYLDWRMKMPYLKYLDLRHNKLHFLSHQDLLFKSTSFYESDGFGPYPCSHKVTIDLRNNLIRFIELPQRMLQILPQRNETKDAYGQVRMLIDDNPLECGCALFNLLRVVRYDVVLTSQLRRVTGHTGMRPAELVIGDLSCSAPNTVKGKKINNTEEWIHHLVPLFGICTLQDLL